MSTATHQNASGAPGPLSGMTLLRFAHAYDTGGGVELHLRDLNRGLSQRNNHLTTLLVHLGKDGTPATENVEAIGNSTLIRIPLRTTGEPGGAAHGEYHEEQSLLRAWAPKVLNFLLFSSGLNRFFVRTVLSARRIPTRKGEAIQAGAKAAELIKKHKIDLVVLHTNGGSDASEVIAAAKTAKLPIALIHHFSNDKLSNISVRQQVARVDTLAGASAVGLPCYARDNFTNLSDAVDLDFFRCENAAPVPVSFSSPVIFAPGRMTPDKGQMDALHVAIALKRRGIKATLVFAGRVDDSAFEAALKKKVADEGLTDAVHFAGELTLKQYRDWFNASYLMLMPTHHHEGMPRTLVDSQAMKVPPIVYDIGGTRDGVRNGETGYLVGLGDIAAMTEHAATLLAQPDLRQRMADNGRRFVESQFSLESFLARHEQFYLKTISLNKKQR